MAGDIKVGSYTGTGAAIKIQCGFVPDFVQVYNATDGDIIGTWFAGMTDGTSLDIAAAAAPNADNGISALNNSADGFGFIAGTDFSESAKVFRYVALKSGQ